MDVGVDFLVAVQGWIRHSIMTDFTAFAAHRDWTALLLILPLGIVFGAAHALTPGHGKTVLASYLVGSRLAVMRGIGVAAVLAFTHVGTAVILALTAAPLITRTLGGAGQAPILENISRGLLGFIGIWFLVRALRGQTHQHREGAMVGVIAGLIPCPLTLFAMFFALARGVPEAGLTFAFSMMLGVGLTLTAVAGLVIVARNWAMNLVANHGASLELVSRLLEGMTGMVLIVVAIREVWF